MADEEFTSKHQKVAQKQKQKVDAAVKSADKDQTIVLLLTGDGKGKSSSAFGMAIRALGHGQRVAIIQFIKGQIASGEELFVKNNLPQVYFHQMGTGFTWETQDRQSDINAAIKTWQQAERVLADEKYDLVILDELTYMLAYSYLSEDEIISAIKNRPSNQSVVVTGRGGGKALREMADTVSEVKSLKHAFNNGVKARPGVDF